MILGSFHNLILLLGYFQIYLFFSVTVFIIEIPIMIEISCGFIFWGLFVYLFFFLTFASFFAFKVVAAVLFQIICFVECFGLVLLQSEHIYIYIWQGFSKLNILDILLKQEEDAFFDPYARSLLASIYGIIFNYSVF